MRITHVSLPVRAADEWLAFFSDVLGAPRARPDASPTVHVGTSTVDFRQDAGQQGDHHLAFAIPEAQLDEAKEWLDRRAALLLVDGADEVECSPAWDAHSVYFDGPDGSVLEFIARRALPHGVPGPFTASDIVDVSEVGMTAPSVPATARDLSTSAGVGPYGGEPGPTFAPVGTVEGLLILVAEGRTWFPTDDRTAAASAIAVHAVGGRPGRYGIGGSTLILTPGDWEGLREE
ncbi:hypothetical protein AX769_03375 [Frondihabitans sp. PAMC 28766]|uniref:VOC family protein n=1 Tax=Frondihabitans sp. PAMC 28766 TaxID=1795630 RepID=UPI00078B7324|nr:VOC family protein [Frondihabitans sp. PAMC 28766]AMM19347.1 hypothetical protein AX769_03375 [Frondihabitans sp. PAMC 28766]